VQLGFVTAILPDLSLQEVLQVAGQTGFDCVEVMCWPRGRAERRYAGVTHIDVAGFDQRAAEEVRALAHRAGVGIAALGYYPMFFTADEWPGGKNLAVSPAIWRRMFAAIPDPHFGLNYDPSHMIWQQMDEVRPIHEFRSRLHHIHAKDARLDRERLDDVGILAVPLEYHTPKLPGLGGVRWGAFFAALTDAGYRGPVCVEVEDRAYEGSLEDRKQALRQSATYLRQFIAKER